RLHTEIIGIAGVDRREMRIAPCHPCDEVRGRHALAVLWRALQHHLRALTALERLIEALQLVRGLLDPPTLKQMRMHALAEFPEVDARQHSLIAFERRNVLWVFQHP